MSDVRYGPWPGSRHSTAQAVAEPMFADGDGGEPPDVVYEVTLDHRAAQVVDTLLSTGLYGSCDVEVLEHLIAERLRQMAGLL